MSEFNKLQTVKRRMFAMRNGIIADTLRRSGSPFRIIFGLNLPQLVEIATEFGPDEDLARTLWANKSTRESQLLAPMLFEPERLSEEKAANMAAEADEPEVADVLVHRLLRKTPYAFDLARRLAEADKVMCRYVAMRLLWHFINTRMDEVLSLAKAEAARNERLTLRPARQIVEEIEFLKEDSLS